MDVTPTLGRLELGGMCFQPVETIVDVSDFQEHRYGYKCIDLFFLYKIISLRKSEIYKRIGCHRDQMKNGVLHRFGLN